MLGEILQANKKIIVVFVAVCLYGIYYFFGPKENANPVDRIQNFGSNLATELDSVEVEDSNSNINSQDNLYTDRSGVSVSGGGGGETNPSVFETSPPVLEGYVAGYGTKTSANREYWILLVSTPQLDINGYEVDLRGMIDYNRPNLAQWPEEGAYVRIYGVMESETVVRARNIQ